ncbi:MAG: peptidase MA family metallohydrolase, partial [Armatimonadota bacterium]
CFIVQTNASRSFGSILSPNVLFYLLNPTVGRLHSNHHTLRFRHELAHLLWGQAYGEAPPLFNEGLAEYAGYLGAADELTVPVRATLTEVPPLADIVLADSYENHGRLSLYRASGAWVQYLVQRWGWDKLKTLFLLTEYADTQILDHFAQVYAQELETVEVDWRDGMMRTS